MELRDKIQLGLLLGAIACFPVAASLYLRTAYWQGGWRKVIDAAKLAVVAILASFGFGYWLNWESEHFGRVIEHPFALSSILFLILVWAAHRFLKGKMGRADDHN